MLIINYVIARFKELLTKCVYYLCVIIIFIFILHKLMTKFDYE